MANLIDYKDRPREIVCEVFDDCVELYIGDNAQETKIFLTLKEFDELTKQVIMAKDDIENY